MGQLDKVRCSAGDLIGNGQDIMFVSIRDALYADFTGLLDKLFKQGFFAEGGVKGQLQCGC